LYKSLVPSQPICTAMTMRRVQTIGNQRQAASQVVMAQTPVVTAMPVEGPGEENPRRRLRSCDSSSEGSASVVSEESSRDFSW
jgi:hypothetical protein